MLSKYKLDFEQNLEDQHVLMVLSRTYGILMVDFSGEGIIQLEIGKPKDHITAFNILITAAEAKKNPEQTTSAENETGSEPDDDASESN